MGIVLAIYICSDKGQPMQKLTIVQAIEGIGLADDRYATGSGAYSQSKRITVRQVSLISQEAIDAANQEFGLDYTPEETRRNILVSGIDLNNLVGKVFSVGKVQMQGIELCEPCDRPSKLSGKANFKTSFENRGGLRAAVLSTGQIHEGDSIVVI